MADGKLTVTLGGLDTDGDNVVSVNQPLRIYKVYDTIEEASESLASTDFSNYEGECIVYIRHVENAEAGDIDYVGAFFYFDKTTRQLTDRLILGSHTHSNPALFNQLAELDLENLPDDQESIICIKKVNPDEFDGTTDYEVKLIKPTEFSKELPDIPSDEQLDDKKVMFLSVTKDGLAWENNFIPNTIFKKKSVVLKESHISNNGRTVTIEVKCDNDDCECDPCECFKYNPEYDSLLVFDNGKLISTESIEQNGSNIIITVADAGTFEVGETTTLLLVRNGVAGILDTIKDEYLTKRDAVKLITNGRVSLNAYVLKTELTKYALKVHNHSQYALKKHNHDGRYADYHHIHREYLTELRLSELLANAIESDDAEDIVLNLIKETLTELNNKYEQTLVDLHNYLTEEQITALLEQYYDNAINTNNILYKKDTENELSLSEVLDGIYESIQSLREDLNAKISDVKDTDIILSNYVIKNDIGFYQKGDAINGITLQKFLDNVLSVEPTKRTTTFDVEFIDDSLDEVGSVHNIYIKPTVVLGLDASSIIEIKSIVTTASGSVTEVISGEEQLINVVLSPFEHDGEMLTAHIEVIAKLSSSSSSDTFELRKVHKVYPQRIGFFGSTANTIIDDITPSSKLIRDLQQTFSKEEASKVLELSIYKRHNTKTMIIAIPVEWRMNLKSVLYLQQNVDIADLFDYKKDVMVEGANDYAAGNYEIWYYVFNEPVNNDMSFKIQLELEDE